MTCTGNTAAIRTPVLIELACRDSVSGLHIFIMAHWRYLKRNKELSLNFTPRDILVFKATCLDVTPQMANDSASEASLNLYNENGDITLRMAFQAGEKEIICHDHASKFIFGDGWGKGRRTNLEPFLQKMKWQPVRILVRAFWTESRTIRYQILFDLTTVCYFDSRFPGPATRITYRQFGGKFQLQEVLEVACFKFSDLQPEERQAIESG